MRCFACDGGLPINNNNNYDPPTGRMYCESCGTEIEEMYHEMYKMKEKPKDSPEMFVVLDEDFDIVYVPEEIQTEDDFSEFNFLPENYNE